MQSGCTFRVYFSQSGVQRLSSMGLCIGILLAAEGFIRHSFREAETVAQGLNIEPGAADYKRKLAFAADLFDQLRPLLLKFSS
ncbi:hypothetical protein D3C75_1114790 [compost metagenome]